MKRYTLSLVFSFLLFQIGNTQESNKEISQTIRGTILDQVSLVSLPGANISILSTDPILGSSSDFDGNFSIPSIPIGRHDIEISYLGYETQLLRGILLTAGKELVLNIELVESLEMLDEITIKASKLLNKKEALNEFATVSARTFSVEETSRYAAAAYDPGRMALNYAGVSMGAADDLSNQIVVRGNSPSGVLWRLEGIEIPNPNHFGDVGNSGGGISMLSSSTLSNSDFFTGAFPAEFGNATAAAFDLKLRNGNNQQREYAIMVGALGVEAALEGPFKKGAKSSYLFNFRYSTLGLLQEVGLNPAGDVLPTYSDVSFKLNFPTNKFGTISLFGLGGSNLATEEPFSEEEDGASNEGFEETASLYNLGLSHKFHLDEKSYLRTVMLYSTEKEEEDSYYIDTLQNDRRIDEFQDYSDRKTMRASISYNRKFDTKNSIRVGAIMSDQEFSFISDNRVDSLDRLVNNYNNKNTGGLLQSFVQYKHRLNNQVSFNLGFHYSKLTFNDQYSLEPRAAAQWQMSKRHRLSFSSGLHSRMEHISFYFFEGTNYDGDPVSSKSDLGLPKSWHNVLGYDLSLGSNMRLKAECYYQYLYNIAHENNPTSVFSLINASDIWDYIGLPDAVNEGTGSNIGLDITFEKFLSKGSYYMLTASVYDSKFVAPNGETYNTQYNGNYTLNAVGGKEWKLKGKKERSFGINGRFVVAGGRRYTPLDRDASILAGEAKLDRTKLYSEQADPYARMDIGLSLTTNRKKTTHSIRLDIQNVTNRENVFGFDFDDTTLEKEVVTQTGLFPFINYRIEF